MKCTCSVYANEPSRWCEKHRPRLSGAELLHLARHRFAMERMNPCAVIAWPVYEEHDLCLVEIWPDGMRP